MPPPTSSAVLFHPSHTATLAPSLDETAEETRFLARSRGSRVTAEELLREVEEYFALGATLRAGDTVVDVGANVGAFALRAADACGGALSLFCFEPSPTTFEALRESFEKNPLLRRTRHTIRRSALAATDSAGRPSRFYNFRRFPTNSTFDLESKRREFEIFFEQCASRLQERLGPVLGRAVGRLVASLPKGPVGRWVSDLVMGLEEVSVEVETLDAVLARERIARVDLLEIDVEGHELDVLRGLGPGSWPRIEQVVLETHDRDGRASEIVGLLARNGLTQVRVAAQKAIDNGLESHLILARRPG